MTIITSTSPAAADRYTPAWLIGDEKAVVFLLRAGTPLEREQMEAELAGEHRAGRVWPWEMQEAIETGLLELGAEDAEALILLAQTAHAGDALSVSDQAVLAEALDILGQHWPPYKLLLAQQNRRNQLLPIVAFRRFCVGWENIPADYARGIDKLVSLQAMSAIDKHALRAAGLRAYGLQDGSGEAKKLRCALEVRRRPGDFEYGRTVPGGWIIDGDRYAENPRLIVPRWALYVVDVWLHARMQSAVGLFGIRAATPYPGPGGWQDQPAALMDAFALLDGMIEKKDG